MTTLMAILTALLLAGCYSGPVAIPDGATPAEIVQLAQEASDKNRYNQAAQYYEAILERFPDDPDAVCGAEYEMAFIDYKQKRYDEAQAGFEALLQRYNAVDGEFLPQKYRILSEIVLEKVHDAQIRK